MYSEGINEASSFEPQLAFYSLPTKNNKLHPQRCSFFISLRIQKAVK